MAGRHHVAKLVEVPGAAGGDAVWKLRQAGRAHQVDVLDLDIAGRAPRPVQQHVDPAGLAVLHLAAQPGITGQFRNAAGHNGLGGDGVGPSGMDPDQGWSGAELGLDQLPRPAQLAGRIRGARQPDPVAGIDQTRHGARIGAVRRHRLAGFVEHRVGEEALVAAQQAAGDELWQQHGVSLSGGHPWGRRMVLSSPRRRDAGLIHMRREGRA